MQISAKKFIGLRVETKNGRVLGRTRDFEIDSDNLEIKNFFVRPAGIVKGLTDGDLIIGKNSVVSIDEERLIVEDLTDAEFAEAVKQKQRLAIKSSPVSASARE